MNVQNTFQIAPGTPKDQQRDIAGAAVDGTKKALDTRMLNAQLIPRPGTP